MKCGFPLVSCSHCYENQFKDCEQMEHLEKLPYKICAGCSRIIPPEVKFCSDCMGVKFQDVYTTEVKHD